MTSTSMAFCHLLPLLSTYMYLSWLMTASTQENCVSYWRIRSHSNHQPYVMQPSSKCSILLSDFPDTPVLLLVSDGGFDHRLTFSSVQVSFCVFSSNVTSTCLQQYVYTCLYQSWQNIAERVMATLNHSLQNVALCWKAMPEEFEKMINNKCTLAKIRKVIERNPTLESELLDSQHIAALEQKVYGFEN